MSTTDARSLATEPAAGQDPPDYDQPDCLFCGWPTRAGAPLAKCGDATGPVCDDCALWCDGNLIGENDPDYLAELHQTENLIAGVEYGEDGYEAETAEAE